MTTMPEGATTDLRLVETSGGPLAVATVSPVGPWRDTSVVTLGYGAWIEAFELQRLRLLAAGLRSRLVVVETPGCGVPGTRLTFRERAALLGPKGFVPVAERMLSAVRAVSDLPSASNGGRLRVIGYSLGCSTGAALAGAIHRAAGRVVDELVLVEPVASRRWAVSDLLRATRAESVLADQADAETSGTTETIAPWVRRPDAQGPHRRRLDLALLANALRRGGLARDLSECTPGRLVVVRGTHSPLVDPQAAQRLCDAAVEGGAVADEIVVPGTHGLWQSLPTVETIAARLRG